MSTCKTVHLIACRKRGGFSQSELSLLLGLKRASALSRVETGVTYPDLATALAYEIAFETPLRDLVPDLHAQVQCDLCRRASALKVRLRAATSATDRRKAQLLTRIVERGPEAARLL